MLRLLLILALLLAGCSSLQSPADSMQTQMPKPPPSCEGSVLTHEARPSTTIQSGAPAVILIRCSGAPEVVDVLVTIPPPDGALGILPSEAAEVDGKPAWLVLLPPIPFDSGTVVSVYVITDGRPERAPVTFTVV